VSSCSTSREIARSRFLFVDLGEKFSEDGHTESLRLDDPRQPGRAEVHRLESVVLVDGQPEETAYPFPVERRRKVGHSKRGPDAVPQVDHTFRVRPPAVGAGSVRPA
jgi:hypothetical protein